MAFAGIVALVAAVVWFQTFYAKWALFVGFKGPLPIQCLYSGDGMCRIVSGIGALAGENPYQPWTFWFGCSLLAVGAVIEFLYYPYGGSRIEPNRPKGGVLMIPGPDAVGDIPGPERRPESYQEGALPKGWRIDQ